MKTNCLLILTVLGLVAASLGARGQTLGGAGSYISVNSNPNNAIANISSVCRVAGFSYGNQYYLAYALGAGQTVLPGISPLIPTVCYGNFTMNSGSPGTSVTFNDPTTVTVPGVPANYNLAHSAGAVVNDHSYLFQFKCNYPGTPTLSNAYYEQLVLPSATNPQPHFASNTPGKVSAAMVKSVGNLFDVASAALGNKMYLFLLAGPKGSPNGIQVWSYDGNATTGPVQETNYTFATSTDPNIGPYLQSIDACDVQLPSGEQAILVTAVYNRNSISQVEVWLFAGGATSPVTLLPFTPTNPPGESDSQASVRIVNCLGNGGNKINSCTIFYSIYQGFGGLGQSTLYTSQIGIPSSLKNGTLSQVGGWSAQSGVWNNNRNAASSQFPFGWAAFSVAAPFGTSYNGYSSVAQYLTLFQKGSERSFRNHDNYLVSSLGQELVLDPKSAQTIWDTSLAATSTMTPVNAQSAVESWNLLGVITGLPPLPQGTVVPDTRPILSVKYDSSSTTSVQTNNATTVSVGGGVDDVLVVSATYKNAAKTGNTNSNTIQLDLKKSFGSEPGPNTYVNDEQYGFLLASAPSFIAGRYDLYAWDGTTSLGYSNETIATNGSTIEEVPFLLLNPSTPISGYPACIYSSFPKNPDGTVVVTYPLMTDIEGWKTPLVLTDLAPLIPGYKTSIEYEGTPGSSTTMALFTSSSNSYSTATSSSIKVGEGIDFLGIKINNSSTVTIGSQTSTTFTTGTTTQIRYPELTPTEQTSSPIYTLITLNAYLNRLGTSTTEPQNWMPTIFQGSQPWLLTWQVTDTGTQTAGGTGGGSGPTGGNPGGGKPGGGPGKGDPGHHDHGKGSSGKGDSEGISGCIRWLLDAIFGKG